MKIEIYRALGLMLMGSFLTAHPALAQTESSWSNTTSGNWSSPANWLAGNVATGATGRAWFTNAISANCTVTLDQSPWTLNSMVFSNNAAYGWAVTNGTLNLGGTSPTLTVHPASTATLFSVLSGSAGLIKEGTGMLTLRGKNTLSGSIVANAGTLNPNPGNSGASGAFINCSDVTVNTGATLLTGANGLFGYDGTKLKPVTVNAGGALALAGTSDCNVGLVTLAGGTLAGTGAGGFGSWVFRQTSSKIDVTEDSMITATYVILQTGKAQGIDVAAGKNLNFIGTITDKTGDGGATSTVIKKGDGSLTLAGANTYKGGTIVSNGSIVVSHNSALGSNTVTMAGGQLGAASGTWVITNAFNLARDMNVDTVGSLTLLGSITNSGALTKSGDGTLTLAGTNVYTGLTLVTNGTLAVANALALPNAPVYVGNGGTGGGIRGDLSNATAVVINRSDDANLLADLCTGVHHLRKEGAGTLSLIGNYAFGTEITVNSGTVKLVNPGGFLPQEIASRLVLNLDASLLDQANGSGVSGLSDLSLTANDAVAHDSANLPTFNAPGSAAALNGRGTLHIGGGTQGLQTLNSLSTISGNSSRSLFAVMRRTTSSSMRVEIGKVGENGAFGIDSHNGGIYLPYTYGPGDKTYTPARPVNTYERYAITYDRSSSNSYGYVNGTLMGSKQTNITTTVWNAHVGWRDDNAGAIGDFAQMLVYDTLLTEPQRQQVEAYLNNKWFGSGSVTNLLAPSSRLHLAESTLLNLDGLHQTFDTVSGSGGVTNGTLTVAGNLVPGGTNAVGTLSMNGSMALAEHATLDWNYHATASDLIQIIGSLTLPNVATVKVSQVTSGKLPDISVLFSGLTGATPMRLYGWTVIGAQPSSYVRVTTTQVQLVTPRGTLVSIF